MSDDQEAKPPAQSSNINLGPFGQQPPWVLVFLALLGGGGGGTLLNTALGHSEIDVSKFATVQDVQRLEGKVDKLDGKIEIATNKMTELRIAIATLTAGREPTDP